MSSSNISNHIFSAYIMCICIGIFSNVIVQINPHWLKSPLKYNYEQLFENLLRRPEPRVFHFSQIAKSQKGLSSCLPDQKLGALTKELANPLRLSGSRQASLQYQRYWLENPPPLLGMLKSSTDLNLAAQNSLNFLHRLNVFSTKTSAQNQYQVTLFFLKSRDSWLSQPSETYISSPSLAFVKSFGSKTHSEVT